MFDNQQHYEVFSPPPDDAKYILKSAFRVTGLKMLGRVGTHIF